MPDLSLNPADLTVNPSSSAAPTLPSKLNVAAALSAQKAAKASNAPPRVDLEPLYTNLKAGIGIHWNEYKEAVSLFVLGLTNQDELCQRTDHFNAGNSNFQHWHNQLIAGILTNAGRELPEPGVAPWVSSNDKPVTVAKPVSGDVAEHRLKTEVMQLPARERRRLKDIPEPEAQDPVPHSVSEFYTAKQFRGADAAAPATTGGKTNWDLEIRKRYEQPLAAETGEFPDADSIQNRMLPICYEEGLSQGCAPSCASFMAAATEHFVKELLSNLYGLTRANMPGGSVHSVLTRRFRQRQQAEEDAVARGTLVRDPTSGLLPGEAKELSAREPLSLHDLRLALEVGHMGLGQFPHATATVMQGYQEGEYEEYQELRKSVREKNRLEDQKKRQRKERGQTHDGDGDTRMHIVNGVNGAGPVTNGVVAHGLDEDLDDHSDWGWVGGGAVHRAMLNSSLDDCLAIGQ